MTQRYQNVEAVLEDIFKQYLLGSLYSFSSSSTSGYAYLEGMTDEEYTLPAILIQCPTAIVDPLSYNWTINVNISVANHYVDSNSDAHEDKVAKVFDKLVVDSDDLCDILNTTSLDLHCQQWSILDAKKEVVGKKWISTIYATMLCNLRFPESSSSFSSLSPLVAQAV